MVEEAAELVGRALRLRTGRRALFPIGLGGGLVLAALFTFWRDGSPWWWLCLGNET